MTTDGELGLTLGESMETCLQYFEYAVLAASKEPTATFHHYGGDLTAAWDLRDDLLAGAPLLEWTKIPASKKKLIREIVDAAERLPRASYDGAAMADRYFFDEPWKEIRQMSVRYFEPA